MENAPPLLRAFFLFYMVSSLSLPCDIFALNSSQVPSTLPFFSFPTHMAPLFLLRWAVYSFSTLPSVGQTIPPVGFSETGCWNIIYLTSRYWISIIISLKLMHSFTRPESAPFFVIRLFSMNVSGIAIPFE